MDPEVRHALDQLQARSEPLPEGWDIHDRRASIARMNALIAAAFPPAPSIEIEDHTDIGIRLFRPVGPSADRVIVYVHGGGFIGGSVEQSAYRCRWMATHTGASVAAVHYRLAPEWPFPAAHDDVVSAVERVWEARSALGLAPASLGIWGDSAGACIAAGVLLDMGARRPDIFACAVLSQPALDDRTVHRSSHLPASSLTWSEADNALAWKAWLGQDWESPPDLAAPARTESFHGLPATYLDIGTLDLFCAEVEDFAARARAAGVDIECRVWPDVPHAFDVIAPRSRVGQEAWNAKIAFTRSHLGTPPSGR